MTEIILKKLMKCRSRKAQHFWISLLLACAENGVKPLGTNQIHAIINKYEAKP